MKQVSFNVFAPTKPHPGQLEVLKALDDGARFVLLRAGRKWRKTSLMVSWLVEKALQTGLVCPYIAPNRVQAKNIAWNDHVVRILNECKSKGVPYKVNETELSVTFPNGGKVMLLGVENAESLRGISNWGACGLDELDDWESSIWPTIVRPNLMPHKAPALVAGTPKGFRLMYEFEKSPEFKSFHFTSYDNPELDRQELDSMVEEYKRMGEDYFNQEIIADYLKPTGTVYKEWNFENNYRQVPYDENLPVHISMDFGVADPTAILWIQPWNHETRVIDYFEASDCSIETIVQVLNSKPYKTAELICGDPAGNARSMTTGTSPIEELGKKGIFVKSKNGVLIPEQIRIAHTKVKNLYVDSDKATRFKDILLNYRYPQKRDGAMNQSNEIPIHDKWSHGARAFEYWVVNAGEVVGDDWNQAEWDFMQAEEQRLLSIY